MQILQGQNLTNNNAHHIAICKVHSRNSNLLQYHDRNLSRCEILSGHYNFKLGLKDFWTYNYKLLAEDFLKKWYYWASHSQIENAIDAAKNIKSHWNGIKSVIIEIDRLMRLLDPIG